MDGPLVPGNINLSQQPKVLNPETGEISTVRSMSFQDRAGYEVLVPTVSPDGRFLTNEEAIKQYERTGKHLGIFATPEQATAFAQQLHQDYAAGKYEAPGRRVTTINGTLMQPVSSHR
jgi:hypothetical protein